MLSPWPAPRERKTPPFPDWLRVVTPQWDWEAPHLSLIQEKLAAVTSGACRYLMLFLPPRHGKSEVATIRYPVWRLEREPECRVCVGCYNQSFAERFGRRARRIAERRFSLASDRKAAMEWETQAGGVFRSCGVGSPPTGEGFDLIVIDDPVRSREEADSEAYRERVWEWYHTDLFTRREPGCAIVLIQTRWHEADLAGRILASEQASVWEVVTLPAFAGEDDPLGRDVGEPLWPVRFDTDALEENRRTQGAWNFAALYQQRPTPAEGALFKVDRFLYTDEQPPGLALVRGWDLAATEGGGDYTAGVLLGKDAEGRFFVVDVARGQWGPDSRNARLRAVAAQDGPSVRIRLAEDPGQAGKDQSLSLARLLAGFSVRSVRVTGEKTVRADPFAAQVNAGNVTLVRGPWNRAFVEELRGFPVGATDDQVDAAADGFSELTAGRVVRF